MCCSPDHICISILSLCEGEVDLGNNQLFATANTMSTSRGIWVGAETDVYQRYLIYWRQEQYWVFLRKHHDCFAWSYKEMPWLDPKEPMHKLAISPNVKPIKQTQRWFCPELQEEIIVEVDKLITARFVEDIQFDVWFRSVISKR